MPVIQDSIAGYIEILKGRYDDAIRARAANDLFFIGFKAYLEKKEIAPIDSDRTRTALEEAITDGFSTLKREVIFYLWPFANEQSCELFVELLKDPHEEVRHNAVLALLRCCMRYRKFTKDACDFVRRESVEKNIWIALHGLSILKYELNSTDPKTLELINETFSHIAENTSGYLHRMAINFLQN